MRGKRASVSLEQRLAASAAPLPEDSIQAILQTVYVTNYFNPSDATYRDLIASGSLGVIRNDSLRVLFGRWESALAFHRDMKQAEATTNPIFLEYMSEHIGFGAIRESYRGVPLPSSDSDLNTALRHPDTRDMLMMRLLANADIRAALRGLQTVAEAIVEETRRPGS